MDVQVMPRRCVDAAFRLRQTENRLRQESGNIENIVAVLSHSDEASMQIMAKKVSRINENLRLKIRLLSRMSMVLEKVASLYVKTEDGIRDHEDTTAFHWTVTYRAMDFGKGLKNVKETFNKL